MQLEGTKNDHLVQLPAHFRAEKKLKHVVKGTVSKCFLNTDRLGASTTSLGILFQYLIILSLKKYFLMPSLNFPWHSLELFPYVLSVGIREKNSPFPSLCPLLRKQQVRMRSPVSLFFSKLEKPTQPFRPGHSFQSFHQLCCPLQNCRLACLGVFWRVQYSFLLGMTKLRSFSITASLVWFGLVLF